MGVYSHFVKYLIFSLASGTLRTSGWKLQAKWWRFLNIVSSRHFWGGGSGSREDHGKLYIHIHFSSPPYAYVVTLPFGSENAWKSWNLSICIFSAEGICVLTGNVYWSLAPIGSCAFDGHSILERINVYIVNCPGTWDEDWSGLETTDVGFSTGIWSLGNAPLCCFVFYSLWKWIRVRTEFLGFLGNVLFCHTVWKLLFWSPLCASSCF